MKKLEELRKFGQSPWMDYISRKLISSGKLKELIGLGLSGMTSNPTIFDNAISKSEDYDDFIRELSSRGASVLTIYDELTIRDIRDAADLFLPVYKETGGLDGYVSLEINPLLAMDTDGTVEEGKRLQAKVSRPNVMFKVPATDEGFAAIEALTAGGTNVNVTLIFSLRQYENSARAYISGIEKYVKRGGDPRHVRSVASVFVSRIDTAVDKLLDEAVSRERSLGEKEKLASLRGKAAVANSLIQYERHHKLFATKRFEKLRDQGVNYQRVLWGSTSTKNPAYSHIKYIQELLLKDTVNTIPDDTLKAFLDHGVVKEAPHQTREARQILKTLEESGISMDAVCSRLLSDGVAAFSKSFESLLATIESKAHKLAMKG